MVQRMTAQNALEGKPTAPAHTIALKCLDRILRARGLIDAMRPEQGRECVLIEPHTPYERQLNGTTPAHE